MGIFYVSCLRTYKKSNFYDKRFKPNYISMVLYNSYINALLIAVIFYEIFNGYKVKKHTQTWFGTVFLYGYIDNFY